MIRITLCPNCHTLQKAGTICSICTCPVERLPRARKPRLARDPQDQVPPRR